MHKKNMIVAMDETRAIGKNGTIPWRLSSDIQHFKEVTTKAGLVVMGRKTWDSIPLKFRPLPGRVNAILSKDQGFQIYRENCKVVRSLHEFLDAFYDQEFYVIGGGKIYELFLPISTRLVVTHVYTVIDGADTFFPEISPEWQSNTLATKPESDPKNDYPYSIVEYTRKPPRL